MIPELRLRAVAPLLAAAVAAGCGDPKPAAPRTATPAATPTAAPATTSVATEPAPAASSGTGDRRATAPQKRRLRAKGFKVRQSRVDGGAGLKAALEAPLPGGGGLTVYAFATRADAEKLAARFRPLSARYPDRFQVAVRGTTVYLGVAEGSERLSPRAFRRAVAAGQGET